MIKTIEHKVYTKAVHDEGEYSSTNEALREMCNSNEYYFQENGAIE